jgi:hypothetical protein
MMKRLWILTVIFFATLSGLSYAGKPVKGCSDVPVMFTFESTTSSNVPSAINGDGNGGYSHGVDRVNAVIHFDSDCNGSRDAGFGLGRRSTRTVSLQFSGISGTDTIGGTFPSFNGSTVIAKPGFIILNLTGYGYPVGSTYYTKMSFRFTEPGTSTVYDMVFAPFDGLCPFSDGLCVDSITNDIVSPDQNSPVSAAWVKVTYLPASGSTPDQWIVEGEITEADAPDVIQRGTLISSGVHRGQFSMPFRIRITALAPLPSPQ